MGKHSWLSLYLHILCVFNLEKKQNKKNPKAINVSVCRVLRVGVEDVWSTSHFITSEQIVNWLQGITVSSGLTQTVNPRLWLAVMKPCKVSPAASGEVSLSQRHQMPKNAHREIKTVSSPQ